MSTAEPGQSQPASLVAFLERWPWYHGAAERTAAPAADELALICGLSRQRVNMALSEFKRVGFVRSDPHKGILLVDVPRLRAYAVSGDGSALEHDRHAG